MIFASLSTIFVGTAFGQSKYRQSIDLKLRPEKQKTIFLRSLRTNRYLLRHSSFPYFLNAAVFTNVAQEVKLGANFIAVGVPLC